LEAAGARAGAAAHRVVYSSSSSSRSGGRGRRVEPAVMCARCARSRRPRAATQFCGARENLDPGEPDARRSAAIDSGGGSVGGVGFWWVRTARGVAFYTLYTARGACIVRVAVVPGCCGSCAVSARRHRRNR